MKPSMDKNEETLSDHPSVFLQTSDLLFAAVMQNHAIYPEIKDKSALGIKDGEQNHVYLLRDNIQVTLDSGVDSPDESAEGNRVVDEPRQSSIVTIFSIWNTMMGTSILAMPWTLSQAGFSLGIVLILLVAAIASYTAYLAVQATEDIRFIKNLPRSVYMDISDASEYHFGKAGRILALVFSQAATIGASIVYYVLLSNFLYNTGEYIFRSANHQFPSTPTITVNGREINNMLCPSRNITVESPIDNALFNKLWIIDRTVPVWLLLILFPLISIKSPTFLGKFTTLATVSVIYLFTLVGIKAYGWGINMSPDQLTEPVIHFRKFFPSLTGTCSLAFFLHNALHTLLRYQRHPENNPRDVVIAFACTSLTCAGIGIFFFIVVPVSKLCIEDNFLNNLVTDVPVFIGRLGLLFQMSTVYPMLVYIIRAQLMHALFNKVYPSWLHVMILHILLVGLGLLFAITYPSIGTIIRFIGALCGFFYIFTIPALLTLMNKRILGHIIPSEQLHTPNGTKEWRDRSGAPMISKQWKDRRTKITWWIRCSLYLVIILLGLLNFIGQFVVLGLNPD